MHPEQNNLVCGRYCLSHWRKMRRGDRTGEQMELIFVTSFTLPHVEFT